MTYNLSVLETLGKIRTVQQQGCKEKDCGETDCSREVLFLTEEENNQ
jgi:hypothetical protein